MSATQSTSQINQKLFEAGTNAKNNPYIQRLIEDDDLRDEAIAALKSVRSAFERANSKGWNKKKIANDKKLHREVEDAISGLRSTRTDLLATTKGKQDKRMDKGKGKSKGKQKQTIVEQPKLEQKKAKQKKRHSLRKLVFVAVIGAVVALSLNENARKMVLDTLFGAEEEFQYSSTTTAGSSNGAN